jgi:hypothetical protein
MNVVFIEHNNQSGTYLFEVPAGVKLGVGETVMVDTRHGETSGVCVCESFELDGSPLETIGRICGARFPLKMVIGKVFVEKFVVPAEKPEAALPY